MSRRGTPWVGPHAPRAASSRGCEPGTEDEAPAGQPGDRRRAAHVRVVLGLDQRAKHEAAGAWLLEDSESTTLSRGVFAQRGRDPCIYTGWCSLHPRSYVCCYYRCVILLLLLLIANTPSRRDAAAAGEMEIMESKMDKCDSRGLARDCLCLLSVLQSVNTRQRAASLHALYLSRASPC